MLDHQLNEKCSFLFKLYLFQLYLKNSAKYELMNIVLYLTTLQSMANKSVLYRNVIETEYFINDVALTTCTVQDRRVSRRSDAATVEELASR